MTYHLYIIFFSFCFFFFFDQGIWLNCMISSYRIKQALAIQLEIIISSFIYHIMLITSFWNGCSHKLNLWMTLIIRYSAVVRANWVTCITVWHIMLSICKQSAWPYCLWANSILLLYRHCHQKFLWIHSNAYNCWHCSYIITRSSTGK